MVDFTIAWTIILDILQVAWIKADTKAILAIHNRVITHNNRMSVIHSDHNTWELTIKSVRRNDSGEYMCQINTDPMKNQVIFYIISQFKGNTTLKDQV
jgi:hypothetical protein